MRNRVIGIYSFKCLATLKRYVGSSINCLVRKRDHIRALNNNVHDNRYLQAAWNKYGAANFEWEILEFCSSESNLLEREQYWIKHLKKIYGCRVFNLMNPVKQRVPSRHMRKAHKNYWAKLTPEERAARTAHLRTAKQQELATLGKQSDAHRELKRKIAKRRWRSPKQQARKEGLRQRFNGFRTDAVILAKISAKAKERWKNPEYRARGLKQIKEASLKAAAILHSDPEKMRARLDLLNAVSGDAIKAYRARWKDPIFRSRRVEQAKSLRKNSGRPSF